MASSIQGFSLDMDLVKMYHAMNKEKKELYLIMKYSDDGKKAVFDEKGPLKAKNLKTLSDKNKHWEALMNKLPDDQIRYILAQVDYKDAKGANQNDIVFVAWIPDGTEIMRKMESEKHRLYILKCLPGIRENVVVNNRTEWDLSKFVKDKLKGKLD